MELLLLPTVRERTLFQTFAAFLVTCNKCAGLPIFTQFGVVSKQVGFASKILEVMCIYTLCFVMLMIIGAPFGFEVEYVKIVVLVTREQMMNQSNFDVLY